MSKRAVECECKQVLPIPDDATSLKCPCGRPVVIPSEDEFYGKSVLLSAATTERRINRLIVNGVLPPSSECEWCGSTHAGPVDIRLNCEPVASPSPGKLIKDACACLFLLPLVPIFPILTLKFGITFIMQQSAGVEVFGRGNVVPVPLCACEHCARELAEPKRRRLFPVLVMLAIIAHIILSAKYGDWILGLGLGVFSFLVLGIGVSWAWRRQQTRWQQNIMTKLQHVPVYAQLLKENPHGVVVVAPWFWLDQNPRA